MAKRIEVKRVVPDVNATEAARNLDKIGKLFQKLFSPLEAAQLAAYMELRSSGILSENINQSVDSIVKLQQAIRELSESSSPERSLLSIEGAEGGIPFDPTSSPTPTYRGQPFRIKSRKIHIHKRIEFLKSLYDNKINIRQGSLVPSLDDKVKKIQAVPSTDYDGRVAATAELTAATRSVVAAELAPALNARIQTMPHETLDQKKELARWVNDQLEPLGLAVKAPNTPELPGKLKASTGRKGVAGEFYFEVYIDGKQTKPAYFDYLPILELTDATPTLQSEANEPEAIWGEKVGSRSTRPGHKRS